MKRALSNHTFQEALLLSMTAAALAAYSLISHYTGLRMEWKLSPYLFPALISVLLAFLSAAMFGAARTELRSAEDKSAPRPYFSGRNFTLTVFLAAAYYGSLKHVPFVISTAALLAAMMALLGERRRWLMALVSVAVSASLWALFKLCLRVDLP